jgi:hypothetical protein
MLFTKIIVVYSENLVKKPPPQKNNMCPECKIFVYVKAGDVGMYSDNFDLTC